MDFRTSERGSTHVVLVVLLIILIIGALGFVFYKNFMASPKTEPVQNSQKESSPTLQTARVVYKGTTYALDYPKGWSESALDPTSDVQEMSITNPDGSIEVAFNVSPGGIGGACDTDSGLKVRYYNVSNWTNTKLSEQPLRLVETMTDYTEGGYRYVIGLSPEGAETNVAEGDSNCTVMYVGVIARPTTNQVDATEKPMIIARIRFPSLPRASEAHVKSMDDIKKLMNTDDYKAAVKILESARKE